MKRVDSRIRNLFSLLESADKNEQFASFAQLMEVTCFPVEWAYEVWDHLKAELRSPNHHTRSRAAQFLCHLAISDPEKRVLTDFPAVWNVTKDEKVVTARHALQSIWRIGLAGEEQKQMVLEALKTRFLQCTEEKNYTLIRFDIIQGIRNLYDQLQENDLKEQAMEWIQAEDNEKYQKKYASVWKTV